MPKLTPAAIQAIIAVQEMGRKEDLQTKTNMSTHQLDNPSHQSAALVETESQRAIQEVQAAMIIAKRFPRDPKAILDRVLNICARPKMAEKALYCYSRGGADITGPSIHLAKAIAGQWGNLKFGWREVEQRGGASTVQAFCWDLETNAQETRDFQVPHERHTKQGAKKLTDPRDIYELMANNASRRERACILGIIDADIIDQAVAQCELTMSATADTSPKGQKNIIAAFAKHSITKEQIEARIQRRIDAITAAQVVQLLKIWRSLEDGMSRASDWFEGVRGAEKGEQKPAPPPAHLRQQEEPDSAQADYDDEPPQEIQEANVLIVDKKTGTAKKPPHPLRVRLQGAGIDEQGAMEWGVDNGILEFGLLDQLTPAEIKAMNEQENWSALVTAMKEKGGAA